MVKNNQIEEGALYESRAGCFTYDVELIEGDDVFYACLDFDRDREGNFCRGLRRVQGKTSLTDFARRVSRRLPRPLNADD